MLFGSNLTCGLYKCLTGLDFGFLASRKSSIYCCPSYLGFGCCCNGWLISFGLSKCLTAFSYNCFSVFTAGSFAGFFMLAFLFMELFCSGFLLLGGVESPFSLTTLFRSLFWTAFGQFCPHGLSASNKQKEVRKSFLTRVLKS